MPRIVSDHLCLSCRPAWDREGGTYYVSPTAPNKMERYRPSVNQICEPLLGSSIRTKEGIITGVSYPPLARRLALFREGLELVIVFKRVEDLFTLATYRRQVTQRGGLPLDRLLFETARTLGLTKTEWQHLAERMPEKAPIRAACLLEAAPESQKVAA